MQRGIFSPLFLPRAQKIRSRARLRARELIALKGKKHEKTLPRSHTYFFGQLAENGVLLGLADAFLRWQDQEVIPKNREQKVVFLAVTVV